MSSGVMSARYHVLRPRNIVSSKRSYRMIISVSEEFVLSSYTIARC